MIDTAHFNEDYNPHFFLLNIFTPVCFHIYISYMHTVIWVHEIKYAPSESRKHSVKQLIIIMYCRYHISKLTPPFQQMYILCCTSCAFSFKADKLSIKSGHPWLYSKERAGLPTAHPSCTISIDSQTQTEHLWYKGQLDQKGHGGRNALIDIMAE